MAALSQQMAMSILDFSTPKIDVGVLDQLAFYLFNSPAGSREQKMAEEILQEFQGHESAWTRVHQILEESTQSETKYVALNILGGVISSQWRVLPADQAEGIKNFIVQTIIKSSSTMDSLREERLLIGKLNEVLILIVKQEWPTKWPSFISDIVGSSKSSESLCQNNMQILKLLSEEIFDFSKGRMVQVKAQRLKDALCAEFAPIFQLSLFVLQHSGTPSLISATLQTLLRFLSWIPTGYIFKTELIDLLVEKFLNVPLFRNDTLSCLAEIGALPGEMARNMDPADLQEIKGKQARLFQMLMVQLSDMLPLETDLRGSWGDADFEQQNFIRALALFLSGWLKEHSGLLEADGERFPVLIQAIQYLLMFSSVDDKEIFKICLEYWNQLTSTLYHESASLRSPFSAGLMLQQSTPRRELYSEVLSQLRVVMIENMAKPEEVLVVEREDGEVVREFVKDTDSSELYKSMRVTLVYLTHLDYKDTDLIMTEKLKRQMDGSEWSYKNLNTLCWAIGSISGTMTVEDEKRFLVNVIKELLSLCENKRGKDAKAIIASNIMYIVGQYPRFLRDHWKFLKTVINKLFEFMHETHAGVQDMACDTFIKIAQKCKKHFIQVQVGEVMPFINEILDNIQTIICDLEPQQVHTFYEAIGCMISAQADQGTRNQLIEKLMLIPNKVWASIVMEASHDLGVLQNMEAVKSLSNVLKTNVAACRRIGHPFIHQLGIIYLDMLHVYKSMGDHINHAIATQGEMVMSQPLFHAMRAVRSEILRLVGSWISKSEDPEAVMANIIPSLLEAVLSNYESSIPLARDPQVLSTMSTIVDRLRGYLSSVVGSIFGSVFESTLTMINQDFETFPEHRRNFYTLLCSIVSHCFDAFSSFSEDQFKMLIDAIVWGFQHPMRDVADTALKTTDRLIEQVAGSDMAQGFYKTFFLDLMQSIFAVVTDSVHFGGINFHAIILARMFALVEQGAITVPLQDENPAISNQEYVRQFVMNLIQTAMPHLQPAQLTVIVDGFYACNLDQAAFKAHLRDFLVQCKEMLGEDLGDLFLQERMTQLAQVQEEKQGKLQAVPGMMNPNQISFADDGEMPEEDDFS